MAKKTTIKTQETQGLDVEKIKGEFPFLSRSMELTINNPSREERTFLDNTASTQMPRAVLERIGEASLQYGNIHRGQYDASRLSTEFFEQAYNVAANLINANSWREIVFGRNATEMNNLVMRGLIDQMRSGDNIVTTSLEHNSNYVPWHGMKEMLKRRGTDVEVRLVGFDHKTGELDMDQLKKMVDRNTKLVTATGASNFMGIKPNLERIAEIAKASGYQHIGAMEDVNGSLFMVDGAQLVPGTHVDVQQIGCDFLTWSFHKMGLPLGVGGLFGKKQALEGLDNFLYGGDMISSVGRGKVTYQEIPWKFTAGTPNILGVIGTGYGIAHMISIGANQIAAQDASQKAKDLALGEQIVTQVLMNTPRGDFGVKYSVPPQHTEVFSSYVSKNPDVMNVLRDPNARLEASRTLVRKAMGNITAHEEMLTQEAIDDLSQVKNVTIYGPLDASKRAGLVAFNIDGMSHQVVAYELNKKGIEVRDGTHCASLAHEDMGIPGSARMSFYVYNNRSDVQKAVDAVREISEYEK